MSANENGNSNIIAIDAQTAPPVPNTNEVHDVAQQMQQRVSRFSQEDQSYQESLVTVLQQLSGQLRATDATVLKNSAAIDKLASQIRNYRS